MIQVKIHKLIGRFAFVMIGVYSLVSDGRRDYEVLSVSFSSLMPRP